MSRIPIALLVVTGLLGLVPGPDVRGADLSDWLKGRWDMDESVWQSNVCVQVRDDSRYGTHGTFHGDELSLPRGRRGTAGEFDGQDDYVDCGEVSGAAFADTNSFTVSAWLYPHWAGGSAGGIVGYSSAWSGWSVLADDSGQVYMRLGDTNARCATAFSTNQWHHFAFVRDVDNDLGYGTNQLILFVDGAYATNESAGGLSLSYSGAALCFGGNVSTSGGGYFDGLLDEVAVWNRALSTNEIAEAASLDLVDGLIAYWMMDEAIWHVATADEVYDSSGLDNVGTYYGEQATNTGYYLPEGKLGNAGQFKKTGGVVRYVNCGACTNTQFSKEEPFSISGWFYREGAGDPDDGIVCLSDGSSGWSVLTDGGELGMCLGSTNKLCSHTVSNDVWTHFAFVRDMDNDLGYGTNRLVLFVDGQKVADESAGSATLSYGSEDLLIGVGSSSSKESWGFKGFLDDLAVWNRTLSSTDVSDLYNSGQGEAVQPSQLTAWGLYRASCLEYATEGEKDGYTMRWGYFRKSFELPTGQVWQAVAEVGDQVIVHVNGQQIEQKPEAIRKRSVGGCYDHVVVNLESYLTAGQTNVVAFYCERVTNSPIAFLQGKVTMADGQEELLDTVISNGWKSSGTETTGWTTVAFDDSGWDSPGTQNAGGFSSYFKDQRRFPVYDGRLRLSNTNDGALYFDDESPAVVKLSVPGTWTGGIATAAWILRQADESGVERHIAEGQVTNSTVDGTSREFSLDLGEQGRGVYTLEVSLQSGGSTIESRYREPLVVVGEIPMTEIQGESFAEGLVTNLETEIDFIDANDPHPCTETVWEGLDENNKDIITEVSTPILVESGGLSYRKTRLGYNNMISYEFEFDHPGDWYLMVLEYPNDKRYATGVGVSRDEDDGYVTESSPGVYTGGRFPLRNEMRELKWLHRADAGPHTIEIISLDSDLAAAASKISMYHVSGNLPALDVPENRERFVGLLSERATYTGINFGTYVPEREGHSYPDGFDMLQLWTSKLIWDLDVSEHYAQYLRFSGQNLHVMGAFQYDEWNLSYEPPDRVAGGRVLRDIRDVALRVFEQNGISMMSTIEYSLHKAFDPSTQYGLGNEEYMPRNVNGTAVKWQASIGHSEVTNAMLYVADELAYRFSGSEAWKGLYFMSYPSFSGPSFYCQPGYPFIHDYSDETIAAYESDTGDSVPGDPEDPGRYVVRYCYLAVTNTDDWVAWRCERVHDIAVAARDTLQGYRADLECMLGMYLDVPIITAWVDSENAYTQHVAQYSLDPTLFGSDTNLWAVRYLYPEGTWRGTACYPSPKTREHAVNQEVIDAYDRSENRAVMLHSGWFEVERDLPNGDFQQRTILSQAPDVYSRESHAQAMIGSDPEMLMYGFTDIGLLVGNEQQLRDFSRVFTQLPADKFDTVLGTTFTNNVVIRDLSKDGAYWFYLVNPGYWSATATVQVANVSSLYDIGAAETVSVTNNEVVVSLEPYGLAAFRDDTGNGSITNYTAAALSAQDLAHMENLISLAKETYPRISQYLDLTEEEEAFIESTANQAQTNLNAGEYAAAWDTLCGWQYWQLVAEEIEEMRAQLEETSGHTIYVDWQNTSGTTNGEAWATAWSTISQAVDALAATNAAEGTNGGHLIVVAAGTYAESVNPLREEHSGTNGAPNVVRALDTVVVDPPGTTFAFQVDPANSANRVTDITIDGFRITGCYGGILVDRCERTTLANCTIYDSQQYPGIEVQNYLDVSITNCLLHANAKCGIYMSGYTTTCTIRNSIITGNGDYGVRSHDKTGTPYLYNCCVYGNGRGGISVGTYGTLEGEYTTDAEINDHANVTNCVARNPGFADLADDWNFESFYTNSPCLNSAEGGNHMGPYQDPDLKDTSSATYYVDGSGGSDANSGFSWAAAWATISHASSNAVVGDTVMVGSGTYTESVTITNGGSDALGILYRAEGDVLINGSAPWQLFRASDVTLDGFRVDGGSYGVELDYAFANTLTNLDIESGSHCVYADGATHNTIVDCGIHDSSSGCGLYLGAVYGPGGNIVRDCLIYDNAQYGADLRSFGNRLEMCLVYENGDSGVYSGNNYTMQGGCLYDCNVYSNSGCGVEVGMHGKGEVYNCTICENAEDGLKANNRPAEVYNTILAGNGGYGANEANTSEGIAAVNCLFWDNGTNSLSHFRDNNDDGLVYDTAAEIDAAEPYGSCTNNIVADPLFVAAGTTNFQIQVTSPCRDAGLEQDWMQTLGTDLYGNSRIRGWGPDIGSHEVAPPPREGPIFVID